MHFTYTFKTGDGERRSGEIDAPTRNEAFALLREKGIRPIRMVTEERETVNGGKGYGKRVITLIAAVAAVVAGIAGYLCRSPNGGHAPTRERDVVEAPVQRIVSASPRHWFDYSLAAEDIVTLSNGERFLGRFARPGEEAVLNEVERAQFPGAVLDVIGKPTVVADSAPDGLAEMKSIIAGLKDEAEVYIRTGSGLGDYLVFLLERQKMEAEARRRIIQENPANEARRILSAMHLKPLDE